jgi:hypothetical protein
MKFITSKPKVEKVVTPPQIPTIQKARKDSELVEFSESFMSKPIRKAPNRLTTKVDQVGKDFMSKPTRARRTEPNAPPAATRRKNFIPIGH